MHSAPGRRPAALSQALLENFPIEERGAAMAFSRDDEARDLVRNSDRRRSQFVQSLVGRSWSDACLFDLTVDTSSVGLDRAAALVTAVTEARLKARD